MDMPPPVAEAVCVVPAHLEAFGGGVLQNRDGVVAALGQEFHRFSAELGGVKAIEDNWPSASLGVPDLSGENRFTGGFTAAVKLKIAVPDQVHRLVAKRLCRAAQGNVPRRIRRPGFRPKFVALFIDDAFTAHD